MAAGLTSGFSRSCHGVVSAAHVVSALTILRTPASVRHDERDD